MNIQVQIVTWNSLPHLKLFFEALSRQTLKPTSVVCIDNNSTDGSKQFLLSQKNNQNIFLDSNTGFCHAHNIGFKKAVTNKIIDAVLICNPDVELHPNAIENLAQGLKVNPQVGTISGVLLRHQPLTGNKKISIIDSAGIQKKFGFRFINRGEGQEFDERFLGSNTEVFANSGACMMMPRSALLEISKANSQLEFFDEAFFAYKEDIDVGWRAKRLGLKNICIASVIGYHGRNVKKSLGYLKKSPEIVRLSHRNHLLLLKKNYRFLDSPFDFPGIIFYKALRAISLFILKVFLTSQDTN